MQRIPIKNSYLVLAFGLLWATTGILLSLDHVFFWDTIQLGSKHAHFYYESGFSYLLLPPEIDSGHPPLFGMYLAVGWLLFGKSLLTSHLLMLPFVCLLIYQWYHLGKHLGGEQLLPYFMLLLLVDPVVASQSILISPDLPLMGLFLLLLNSILHKNVNGKMWAILGLGMISMRGMMVGFLLFFWEWLVYNKKENIGGRIPHFLSLLWPYLPGGLLAMAFLGYHYVARGWVGFHENSEWAPSFALADGKQLLKNIAVLVWRWLDFGRVFISLAFAGMFLTLISKRGWKAAWKENINRQFALLLVFLLAGLSFSFLRYAGLQQHRYLLPLFLIMTVFFYLFLLHFPSTLLKPKRKRLVLLVICLGLFSGNFWVYPDKISQGWDSTLAHWPHYELRTDVLNYLEEEGIALERVGTAFPEIGPLKFKDLSEESTGFKQKDLLRDSYILYSNIMNDFTDEEIDELRSEWKLIYRSVKWNIKMELYAADR